ncbi:hypothetical protein ACFL1Z_00650 [Thermodesulfobacteriota bacterium]
MQRSTGRMAQRAWRKVHRAWRKVHRAWRKEQGAESMAQRVGLGKIHISGNKVDGFIKSRKCPLFVIPAPEENGINCTRNPVF